MLATSPEVQRKEADKNVELVSNTSNCQLASPATPVQDENEPNCKESNQSENEEYSETSSEVTKTYNDESSSTEALNDSYLADESSFNANSVTEVSELTLDNGNVSECDHASDRTSPSKSIPEISAENLTDTENHEHLSEPNCDNLTVSKLDSIALNSSSNSRDRSISTDSSANTSLEQYEEFSSNEIAEAKRAVDLPTEHIPINPDRTSTPEPHSASPIREVLLTLQKEASKYRNIQVGMFTSL